MDDEDFLLEECKHVRSRIITHENRRLQITIFCLTSFAAVFGFSDKIPKEAIPYILLLLLLITSTISRYEALRQKSSLAFLIELLEKNRQKFFLENAHAQLGLFDKKTLLFPVWLRHFLSFIISPFFVLTIVGFAATFYYSSEFIKNIRLAILYIGLLVLGYILVVINIFLERSINTKWLRSQCKNFLNQDKELKE